MFREGGQGVLSKLTRRLRIRTALALVALYAVCILAPHAAMAFSAPPAHCLTDASLRAHVHGANAPAHTHAGGAGHHRDGHDHAAPAHDAPAPHDHADAGAPHKHDGKSHPSTNCCGVFCLSAIGCEPQAISAPAPVVSVSTPALDEALVGRGPGRINRPPIA
jgi:hypothetical protein